MSYRIRVGTYRVIYSIEDDIVTVTIIRVAHRGIAYRPLP
jgi:mRNA interferase RelE/StbE